MYLKQKPTKYNRINIFLNTIKSIKTRKIIRHAKTPAILSVKTGARHCSTITPHSSAKPNRRIFSFYASETIRKSLVRPENIIVSSVSGRRGLEVRFRPTLGQKTAENRLPIHLTGRPAEWDMCCRFLGFLLSFGIIL